MTVVLVILADLEVQGEHFRATFETQQSNRATAASFWFNISAVALTVLDLTVYDTCIIFSSPAELSTGAEGHKMTCVPFVLSQDGQHLPGDIKLR